MFPLLGYLLAVSLAVSLIVTPLAAHLGRRWGVLDKPGPRKVHQLPMPLSGGWAIFFTFSLVLWGHLLAALLLKDTSIAEHLPDRARHFMGLAPSLAAKIAVPYLGALAMFLLGLFDDLKGMSVKSRLVVQIGIAGVLVTLGLRPELGFLPAPLAAIVGMVWIIGITNAFNLIDGLDGLSAGIALIATTAMSTIMILSDQPNIAFLLMVVGGSTLGFLRYNYQPAKIFLGSSGSLLIGYLMALCTSLVTFMQPNHHNWLFPIFIPPFILAIPIYDTTSVVLLRLLRRRSIAIGDQSHFHHRLLKLGFSHSQTVVFIWLIAFAVALSAVRLTDAQPRQSVLILLQIVAILMIVIIAERVAGKARKEALNRRRFRKDTSRAERHPTQTPNS